MVGMACGRMRLCLLAGGKTATVKLLAAGETRDQLRSAVRPA